MKNFFPLFSPDPGAGGGGAGGAPAGGAPAGTGVLPAGGAPAGGAPAGGQPAAGGAPAGGAPSPYYSDLIGKDGTLNHASFERLPENLKPLTASLANIKTADELFAKISHLNTLAGRKALGPLAADAKPEDIAAQQTILRAVNGTPEKPEGYAFARPENLPEAAWDPTYAKTAQELLHKHNASPALAKDLLALQTNMVMANIQAQQKYEQDFYAGQDREFREALTKDGLDYDKTNAFIERVATQFGLEKDAVILKNAGVRLMLNKVGVALGEAKFVGGNPADGGNKSDRATAEDIIHNKANPDYAAYWDSNHAKNGEVKKRVEALLQSAAKADQAAQGGGRR